jgi:hypothetical protein
MYPLSPWVPKRTLDVLGPSTDLLVCYQDQASNLTVCSLVALSIFSNRFATQL